MKNICKLIIGMSAAGLFAGDATIKNPEQESWNAKLQSTYIWMKKPSINSPYAGDNSLKADSEESWSWSVTPSIGARLWNGGEFYFNLESGRNQSLSELHGLGGPANGDDQKDGGKKQQYFTSRLFIRQVIGLGGKKESMASDANQLASSYDKNRIVLTLGKISVTDIFDNNAFSHDARTQFLNWAFTTYGAFDYAADSRGYTIGIASELYYGDWVFRIGRFMMPTDSNGRYLDTAIGTHFGDQVEIEHSHKINNLDGKLRALVFRNKSKMGSFSDAVNYAAQNGSTPDVANVRQESYKTGYGVSLEQYLTNDIGAFARYSRADGKTETFAFTEIERSVSCGLSINGSSWGRDKDTLGIAVSINGLSDGHKDYLSKGGLGAFIGDGKINYRSEEILEGYYSANIAKNFYASFDYQRINNPAYNADRGPADIYSVRLHLEF